MRPTGPTGIRRRDPWPLRSSLLAIFLPAALLSFVASPTSAHDIPNARVDRSIQVTLEPGRIRIAYEVSLSELTLTQELRSLIGGLPGADRRDWLAAYGRETGPLNGKGFLLSVDHAPVSVSFDGFDLNVEEHPRYTFRFSAELPPSGRLSVRDTNFASSEGMSRLAVRGLGVTLAGDSQPADVQAIPLRPLWQLTDEEERRTHAVVVDFSAAVSATVNPLPVFQPRRPPTPERRAREGSSQLSRLLDEAAGWPLAFLGLIAFGLGAAHAVQPGHGKTLVATTVVSENGDWPRGVLLAVVTTLTHTGSVFLVAAFLWWTESLKFGAIHQGLARSAGFVIASIGLWRLGRHLAGYPEHEFQDVGDLAIPKPTPGRITSLIGLGIAGGLVPCWDAVGLIVLAEGRIGLGLMLVVAFSLGMGLVLVAIGWFASRLRRVLNEIGRAALWERRLGLASGLVLSMMGIYLLRY
jgi:nickel/cobalt transporter (NicO) family protein